MMSRGAVLFGLVVLELAVVGEGVVALRGGSWGWDTHVAVTGNGPSQHFYVGPRPALNVDIGYADLTIIKGDAPDIEVSVSGDGDGMFGSNGPISATRDGDTIRIAAGGRRGSMGDDRMVTVRIPAATDVSVIQAGDITANGLRGNASFNSVGRGTISITDFDAAALRVVSSNGKITLRDIVAQRLDATSNRDEIDASGLAVKDGSLESDDDMTLAFTSGSNTVINADAGSGSVKETGFPTSAAAAVTRSGDDDDDVHAIRSLRVGQGAGHLEVHASNADISLAQEN